jgi:hypothetical protein
MSDGLRLYILLFDKNKRERWFYLIRMESAMRGGAARESDTAMHPALGIQDNSWDAVQMHWLTFVTAIRREDFEAASQGLENCLASSGYAPESVRETFIIEAAGFHAMLRRASLGREWLSDAKASPKNISYLRAEALVLQAESRFREALARIEESLLLISKLPNGEECSREEAWQQWKGQLQKSIDESENSIQEAESLTK